MTMHERVSLAHGNGGRLMRELIEEVFWQQLGNDWLRRAADASGLGPLEGEIMLTCDGFTVQPLNFVGGALGSLAVHGVVNDLAVAGGEARYLTLGVLLEEGFPLSDLRQQVAYFAAAASAAGVAVVAGDTKVVPRGQGGGLYLSVTGLGLRRASSPLGFAAIRPGDRLLVSGPVGDHGAAVLLAREEFGLAAAIESDSASVLPLCRAIWHQPGLRFMRDPTRGGLATVLHEIAAATGCGVTLQESTIPVREPVRSLCDMLGYDPLYLACEGRVVAVVAEDSAAAVLAGWRALPQGEAAAVIGEVTAEPGWVSLVTELGGARWLPELEGDFLPRIC